MVKLTKLKKQEKARVKLKVRKLPKGQNVTNTSFKAKKIVIPGQLSSPKDGEIHTKKKLNVTELISHLQHHRVAMRREGLEGLNELMIDYENDLIELHLPKVISAVCSLILDLEYDVRKSAVKLLGIILDKLSYEQLLPHFTVLRTYMACAMTHINRDIREGSILLLDCLLNVCPFLMASKADDILPLFLNMISKVKGESEGSRTLSVDLSSKFTGIRWRLEVFGKLTKYFAAIVDLKKPENKSGKRRSATNEYKSVFTSESATNTVEWSENSRLYAAEFISFSKEICHLPNVFSGYSSTSVNIKECDEKGKIFLRGLSQETSMMQHVKGLMIVVFESWVEVTSEKKNTSVNILSNEAAVMLQYIVETLLHIWDCLENWDKENNVKIMVPWFISEFGRDISRLFIPGFPFSLRDLAFKPTSSSSNKIHKSKALLRQEHSFIENVKLLTSELTQQNLLISYLLICVHDTKNTPGNSKTLIQLVVKYVESCVLECENIDLLPLLEKVLRRIVGKPWPIAPILQAVAKKCQTTTNTELRQIFFLILSDFFVMSGDIMDLSDPVFGKWISELPYYLFQNDVSLKTVKSLQTLASHNHAMFISSLQRKAKFIIRSLFEIKITDVCTTIEGRKAIIDLLFYVADSETFNSLLRVIGNSEEDEERRELLKYVTNLKGLLEYLEL